MVWFLEWIVRVPCAIHDAYIAFKWSMKAELDSVELLRASFIGMSPLRKSMAVILKYRAERVATATVRVAPSERIARSSCRSHGGLSHWVLRASWSLSLS